MSYEGTSGLPRREPLTITKDENGPAGEAGVLPELSVQRYTGAIICHLNGPNNYWQHVLRTAV
jgi:hypothetical protein